MTRYIQAWRLTHESKPSMLVYDQKIALDKFSEGYDLQILTIVRHDNGDREYLDGTLASEVQHYRGDVA